MSEGYEGLPSYYVKSSDPVTPKYGFSLKGMDPILAENWVLADAAIGSGGSTVEINGVTVSDPNFNNTTPAAPVGDVNVTWQVDASGNVSAYVSLSGGSSVEVNGVAVSNPNFNNTTPAPVAGYLNSVWTTDGSGNVSSSIFPDSVTALTTGSVSPVPVYTYNEAPSTINPFFYIQDAAGNWHQQAGIDTLTGPVNYPNSGPPVPGTLTWTRRMFFRDDLASTQVTKNSFLSVKHAAGSGTSQENQDRALGILMVNGTVPVTAITVSNGTVTFSFPVQTLSNVVPGQVYVLTGFSTYTQYNQVSYYVETVTTSAVTAVVAPLTLQSANTAVSGNTTYSGYINQRTLTGQSVLIAGFSNAANNGTFTIVSNNQNNIVVNNPNGIAETPSGIPTATVQLANQSRVSDSGTLDQWIYSMAGIQCEVDLNGNSPQFTEGIDGELTVFSGQISLANTGPISIPSTGIQVVRAQLFKSGAGSLGGSNIGASAVTANVSITNIASNGYTEFVGVVSSVTDGVGGAPQTVGIDYLASYGGSNRCAYSNYGLYVNDFSASYTVTSVLAASGGLTTYLGSFPAAGSLFGQSVRVTGLSNAVNNGVFQVSSSSTTSTLVLNNPSGVPETTTVRIQMLNDYAIRVVGGQTYLGGTLQLVGGFIDSTGSYGTNGQVLSSTGTATLWANASGGGGLWNNNGNANGNLTLANSNFTTTFNQTSGVAWTWANTTVGTSSSVNSSPVLQLEANYYSGSLSEPDTWSIGTSLGVGVNGSSLLGILHSGTSGLSGVLIGNSQFTTSVENSPYLVLGGSYEVSASLNTFAEDNWYFQNVVGSGAEGSSTLQISHAGTTGAIAILLSSACTLQWSNASVPVGAESTPDTSLSRVQAGVVAVGNGTQGNASGTLLASSVTITGSLNLTNGLFLPNVTTATTQTASDNSTKIATTAYTDAAVGVEKTRALAAEALLAPLASPSFTGVVTISDTAGNTDLIEVNTTTGTNITTNASPTHQFKANYYTGSTSAADTWTIGSALAAGTNGASTLTIAHSGSSGAATVTTAAVLATSASLSAPTLNFFTGATSYGSLTNSGGQITLSSNAASTGQLALIATAFTGTNPAVIIGLGGSGSTNAMTGTSGVQTGVTIGLGGNTGAGQLIFAPTSGSANFVALQVNPKVNQTSSASGSYTGLLVNVVETALLGTSNKLLDLQAGTTGGTSQFSITNKGIVSKYNAIATVGNGVPAEYAASDLTAQSAAIAATTLYATTATGMYRVSWSATITTPDGVSSVLGGTNGFQVLYTSPTDSVVKTTVAGNSVTSAANTTGTAVGGCEVIYAKTGTNIQFQYGYTSATPGQMVFELHCKVEAL